MIWTKNKCINGGNEHNFKPRYNEKPNPNWSGGEFDIITADKLREMMVLKIYVKDICEWCGKIIKREN
jgi:hypothetical protein